MFFFSTNLVVEISVMDQICANQASLVGFLIHLIDLDFKLRLYKHILNYINIDMFEASSINFFF